MVEGHDSEGSEDAYINEIMHSYLNYIICR
jgi:hypothetical protein